MVDAPNVTTRHQESILKPLAFVSSVGLFHSHINAQEGEYSGPFHS